MPAVGEQFDVDGLHVEVLEAERRRVTRVRVRRKVAGAAARRTAGERGVKAGFVSLVGLPNAGKSTLLNRLVGTKLAIVSDKPQTTRNRILGVRNYPGGQVVYLDTPGIHRPVHRMNVRMLDAALDAMRDADVVGIVLDVTQKPGGGQRHLIELIQKQDRPVLLILNKIDLVAKRKLLPIIDEWQHVREFAAIVPVSATTGDGVDGAGAGRARSSARGRGAVSGGLPDGSTGAILRRRDRPRAGAAAHARRAAVLDRGRRGPVRGAGRRRAAAPLLLDPGRARVAEADRHRPRAAR